MQTPTQEQLWHQSHRSVNDTLQQAYWMAGKMPDRHGEFVAEPLTHAEMEKLANSDRPYAWAFQSILDAGKLNDSLDQYRTIGISTAHITATDAQRLDIVDHPRLLARDTGAFIKLLPMVDDDTDTLAGQFPGFSDAFYQVLATALAAGYQMVELDADATQYDHLPVFEW